MKTAEKIKKGLIEPELFCNHCQHYGEPNGCNHPNGSCEAWDNADSAKSLIQQLEAKEPRWVSVEERLPENDVPVLVSAKRKGWNGKEYNVVFTAFHTDGTTHTEDSGCDWNLEDTGLKYCEETDDYIIPEAWWEDVRYGEEFSKVYDTYVTHWMPLPEPPEVTKP